MPMPRPMPGGGAQPVMLTRMHVRYTPNSFPEDLMFTQTQDRQNWQTRYVMQNPYQGSSEQCVSKLSSSDCAKSCKERVQAVYQFNPQLQNNWQSATGRYGGRNAEALVSECMVACDSAKRLTLDSVNRYYQVDLPERLRAEKQSLARLTGWGMAEIDKMPGATR